MKRSIALVAAALTLSLGLLAGQPAEASGKHGYRHGHKHGYSHGYSHGHAYKHAYRHGYKSGFRHGRHHDHRGFADSTLLAAVGIRAGAEVIGAYLQRPPAPAPVVYAAPTYVVRQPVCTQVLVPYPHPYGGYYYAPQVQCY